MSDKSKMEQLGEARSKASESLAKAKEAHEKNATAANKTAMEKAQEALKAAIVAENRERFVTVGTNRTRKARAMVRQLIKVANPKTYSYSAEEAAKIVTALQEAVDDVRKAFATPAKSGGSGDSFAL